MAWSGKIEDFLHSAGNEANTVAGVSKHSLALLILHQVRSSPGQLAVVLPEVSQVNLLERSLEQWTRKLNIGKTLLTIPEGSRGKMLFPGAEAGRAKALNTILNSRPDIVIGSINAFVGAAPPPVETRTLQMDLRPGTAISPSELCTRLTALDYDDEVEVGVYGEFARRGGIVDVFSPAHDQPCRIEFFGNKIDSMRFFSPETQRTTGKADCYRIINRSGVTAGGAASCDVFDYFTVGGGMRLLIAFPEEIADILQKYASTSQSERWREVTRQFPVVSFTDVCADDNQGDVSETALHPPLPLFSGKRAGGDELSVLEKELYRQFFADKTGQGTEILVCADAREQIKPLEAWLRQEYPELGSFAVTVWQLDTGCWLSQEKLLILAADELNALGFRYHQGGENTVVNEEVPERPENLEQSEIGDFSLTDFADGDYVVHNDYGIARYHGVTVMDSGGEKREVMILEYRDDYRLFVPLTQVAKVCRYLGVNGEVKLHKFGGSRWDSEKERAKAGVRAYAADMLRLQAVRAAVPGIAFHADAGMMAAFIAAFPYRDTKCQARTTIELKNDMLKPKPMDRLLCGDVGYGKTEMAMRAAFRAVAAGYQVAVIAPTTVLVQQHYGSFCERFRQFPFVIEQVSRFRTAGEKKQVADRLKSGGIDIIIGTHTLCGQNFQFRNLGLVVIDEEQRFGVEHKERLRRFRVEADVLSMSATPIPRTLYLSLAGVRDMSTLMTPPKLRLPVKTVVAPLEDSLIVNAVTGELARGGQVYYLHNRVQTIAACADKLRKLMPSAVIGVAHGQMSKNSLDEVMSAFTCGKIDCLVCSTIIESGIDVRNANTIIIEHADKFGLSQLYQLRGRVGRWKNQAYAYMLIDPREPIGTNARKRLSAIRHCSNLGDGFRLAMHDLEIRGSGNLLGPEQSGHINMVGFDLYCRLLKHEVADLNREQVSGGGLRQPVFAESVRPVDTDLDFVHFALFVPAGIAAAAFPPEYIEDETIRLAMYRRWSALSSPEDVADFTAELRDRFGVLPETAKNLLEIAAVEVLLLQTKFRKLQVRNGAVYLFFSNGVIYREHGRLPQLDCRDSVKMQFAALKAVIRRSLNNGD